MQRIVAEEYRSPNRDSHCGPGHFPPQNPCRPRGTGHFENDSGVWVRVRGGFQLAFRHHRVYGHP